MVFVPAGQIAGAMDDVPTEKEFRDAGFTANAINFPRSERGFRWLCWFNGAKPEQAPRAWRYAPNAWCQKYCDEQAEKMGL
jgi:hypothetical protein